MRRSSVFTISVLELVRLYIAFIPASWTCARGQVIRRLSHAQDAGPGIHISRCRFNYAFMISFDSSNCQARVQGGGARGLPPPLEIEKKRLPEKILSYFTYILLIFFSRKYHFLIYFQSWAPPPEKLKSKKKIK